MEKMEETGLSLSLLGGAVGKFQVAAVEQGSIKLQWSCVFSMTEAEQVMNKDGAGTEMDNGTML